MRRSVSYRDRNSDIQTHTNVVFSWRKKRIVRIDVRLQPHATDNERIRYELGL